MSERSTTERQTGGGYPQPNFGPEPSIFDDEIYRLIQITQPQERRLPDKLVALLKKESEQRDHQTSASSTTN